MSELDMFKGNALVNADLFKSLMDMNKRLSGGSNGSGRRISIKGGKFRMMVDGEQVGINKGDLNVVIVDAAAVARTYYEGSYDPENPSAPTCWSHDTRVPAPEVAEENRKAPRCADCPMNVKGSGQGDSRACRFSQRLAVVLDGALDEVYQMQIPAASIFGSAEGREMGLQAYVKYLSARNVPVVAVMTQLSFDDNSEAPKLFFKPVRPLDNTELQTVLDLRGTEDVTKAITLTVSQTDNVKPAAKADKPKPAAKVERPKPTAKVEVEPDDVVEEPKKVEKPKPAAAAPAATNNLADILAGWDDDEDA